METLDPILKPRSIAVIGASRRPNTVGWQILDNLLKHGFTGAVYPVNPRADSIHSIKSYPSVADIPDEVDLAVVVVPKEHVETVVRESIESGVRGIVIISAGFKEVGGKGIDREQHIFDLVRSSGVRLVGPNCMGVINTDAGISMNATFAPTMPPSGPVAFMSQSGAMGLSILDYAKSLGIGISMFVSAGNKADVSGNDLLQYWRHDESTELILMYLENFGNPRRFVELCRAITPGKPICVVKSGRTGAGARAAASHTGALAQTDLATDAIIRQAGAIRAQTVEELFDLAMAFSNQPLPKGNRVAIVTNAGGPGIILADACESHGLVVTDLSDETKSRLRSGLPEEASVGNPVDMIASATAASYELALEAVLTDPNTDAAIAAFVPPLGVYTEDIARALAHANRHHPAKPLLAVIMGQQGLPAGLAELHAARIPAYIFPESAARALAAMAGQQEHSNTTPGRKVEFNTGDNAVREAISRTRRSGSRKVSEPDAMRVLEAYGIPVTSWIYIEGDGASLPTSVQRHDLAIEFPVAAKIVSPDIIHKTDVGGVVLGIQDRDELKNAVTRMCQKVLECKGTGTRIDGVLVQSMAPGGRETIAGMTRMPLVGPMIMFGLGGIYVEALKDVVLRMAPVLDSDARQMVREVKMFRLLEGLRGEPPRDLDALEEVILRLSQLAERHPEIEEMDINPLISLADGVIAVDARIQLSEHT